MDWYNDNDPGAVQWLEGLVRKGLIPQGDVDARSITEVTSVDLEGRGRCHFFAGIGGWARALQIVGWPSDLPVWTGSCPCQPFSNAGKRKGTEDERHLWPEWRRLIDECRPPVLFGEQVASKLGRAWLAAVRSDLEGMGYVVGAADLCAAGVGAPHIRQRLFFGAVRLGYAECGRFQGGDVSGRGEETEESGSRCCQNRLADAGRCGLPGRRGNRDLARSSGGASEEGDQPDPQQQAPERGGEAGFWGDVEWIPCLDGKARPAKPGICPLAPRVSGRLAARGPGIGSTPEEQEAHWYSANAALRGFGNAIVPPLAAVFIRSFMEAVSEIQAKDRR